MIMGQFGYAETNANSGKAARAGERALLRQSIDLLKLAKEQGTQSKAAVEAVYFTNRLWTAFIEDLGGEENRLEPTLRANLISIGISILRSTGRIREGDETAIDEIVEVSGIILDGLR
ncbi:flagellar biosynthesis regulatory protein FlaF [Ahrensia sp. R2A130]|nr:flagellar biosynthesis regulatory protein FlaF [Ahrensia sp. R2A130]